MPLTARVPRRPCRAVPKLGALAACWPHTERVITVREAQAQDAAEVAGVHVRSWQVAYRGLFPDDYLDGLRAEDRMAHYTFGDGRPGRPATLVAVIDATICGFVAIGSARDEDAADAGEVDAIYVDPQAWGRGIGRSLIAEARTRLSRQGFTEAVL
jgi:ribosomal protein S18 acetylase RimI-like enzyme